MTQSRSSASFFILSVKPPCSECITFKPNDVDVIFVTHYFTLIIVTGWVFVLSSGAD